MTIGSVHGRLITRSVMATLSNFYAIPFHSAKNCARNVSMN